MEIEIEIELLELLLDGEWIGAVRYFFAGRFVSYLDSIFDWF